MNRWHPFTQIYRSRLKEFYREPEALFWVYGFPLLLAIVLAIAFAEKKPDPAIVDVQDGPDRTLTEKLHQQLKDAGIKAELHSKDECDHRLNTGASNLYVVVGEKGALLYVYDQAREDSVRARFQVDDIVQHERAGPNAAVVEDVPRSEPGTRYIDFLMPGLIGLNLMGGGLWSIGFVLVDMRVRKLLKRLVATPMRRDDFLMAMLSARMTILIPDMTLLVLVGLFGFHVPFRGDFFTLLVVILAGSIAFSGLGLLIACRTDKSETVQGLMNLVMLPMWLMSGTFFLSSRFPDVMQPFINALPLTQLNYALRGVMLEGQGLATVGWRLGILLIWGIVTFVLGLRWFRWQ